VATATKEVEQSKGKATENTTEVAAAPKPAVCNEPSIPLTQQGFSLLAQGGP
jgi:hypothetical protein